MLLSGCIIAGELSALEELVTQLVMRDKPLLSPQVLSQLWPICTHAHRQAAGSSPANSGVPTGGSHAEHAENNPGGQAEGQGGSEARARVTAGLAVISMAAAAHPELVADNMPQLLEVPSNHRRCRPDNVANECWCQCVL